MTGFFALIGEWGGRLWRPMTLYVLFLLMLVGVIASKKNYFIDEIYSYGLANHVMEDGEPIWIQPKLAPYTYASGGEAYYEYMTVQEGERFNFANVWKNQANDVHPPLYYVVIHLICSLLPGMFTKWQAGFVNILFALLALGGFRYMISLFLCCRRQP